MLGKSYLILILIVLALTASLEALPKYVIFNGISPPNTSSPLSKSPYGLSKIVSIARDEGYKVTFIGSPDDLAYVTSEKVVILVIAPNYISKDDISSLVKNLRKFEDVSVIVADEIPGLTNSAALSWVLSKNLCGNYLIFPEDIQRPLFQKALVVISYPKRGMYSLLTAYVAKVRTYVSEGSNGYRELFPKSKGLEKLPIVISGSNGITIDLLGVVTGIENVTGAPQEWVPYMVGCFNSKTKRNLVIIGDSSIFINEATNKSLIYAKNFVSLINLVTGGNKNYNLVFIMDFYVPPKYRLKYRFLPSIFLTWAVKAYKNVEDMLFKNIKFKVPIVIIVLSLVLLLLPLSFVPDQLRLVNKVKKKVRKTDLNELCSDLEKWIQINEMLGYKGYMKEKKIVPKYCSLIRRRTIYAILKFVGMENIIRKRILTAAKEWGLYPKEEKENEF